MRPFRRVLRPLAEPPGRSLTKPDPRAREPRAVAGVAAGLKLASRPFAARPGPGDLSQCRPACLRASVLLRLARPAGRPLHGLHAPRPPANRLSGIFLRRESRYFSPASRDSASPRGRLPRIDRRRSRRDSSGSFAVRGAVSDRSMCSPFPPRLRAWDPRVRTRPARPSLFRDAGDDRAPEEPSASAACVARLVLQDPKAPRLVIVGARGWENEQVADILDRSVALKAHVVEISRLASADLVDLLRGARALLVPSFGEGYGLPVVEALRSARRSSRPTFQSFGKSRRGARHSSPPSMAGRGARRFAGSPTTRPTPRRTAPRRRSSSRPPGRAISSRWGSFSRPCDVRPECV